MRQKAASSLTLQQCLPVYLCEACGNPVPEARRKIFPGVTLCVECQAYQERQ
ncbi:TraR/DksA C4-type zinc finger protein, partial [Escherichia coli]|uniref:TraR/DksA C4-type zinc finger protein n=1 Tax=Escherichia coli TaxID=562 RepID=UPI0028768352